MCAHAVRMAVEDVPGVVSAVVSLNDGLVDVSLEPKNDMTVAQLRQLIRLQGFSPKGAAVQVRGDLESQDGRVVLIVPGSGQTFVLDGDAQVEGELLSAVGTRVTVKGRIEDDQDDATPERLQVEGFSG